MRKVILAGIRLLETEDEFREKLKETENLCEACQMEVVGLILQKSDSLHPHTAFRKGKIEELAEAVRINEAQLVVFQNTLPISAAASLAEACGVNVIDRTSLILDIFSLRARSKQAKLQTELARLQYDMPRALVRNEAQEHARGGMNNRGAGEMRSRLVERRYARRMQDLKKELKRIQEHQYRDEQRRQKTMLKRAALVGYTNAGKSSLMNAFLELSGSSGKEVYTEDMLFATLDTSVRVIKCANRQFLLYDTVGFVSDLPHTLVEAFQSTLDAAKEADLLIHVIDRSASDWEKKADITEQTLRDIGAEDIPVIRLYNKVDLVSQEERTGEHEVSCLAKTGLQEALKDIADLLYPDEEQIVVTIPYDSLSLLAKYRAVLEVEEISHEDEGMTCRLSGPHVYVLPFYKFQ